MSEFSSARRKQVTQRAAFRCEYCHLSIRGQVATFPIDHIIPRHADGPNTLDNLALTCPHCNGSKGIQMIGPDPETGTVVTLFHPRLQEWNDHFAWSDDGTMTLLGLTAVGRTTIEALRINHYEMLQLRKLLKKLKLVDESE